MCSLSSVMVTSPYKRNIVKLDYKPQINKQKILQNGPAKPLPSHFCETPTPPFSSQPPTYSSSLLNSPPHQSSLLNPQSLWKNNWVRSLGHTHYMTCTVYVNKQNYFNLNDPIGLKLIAVIHGFVSRLLLHIALWNIPLIWRPRSCTEAFWSFCSLNNSPSEI